MKLNIHYKINNKTLLNANKYYKLKGIIYKFTAACTTVHIRDKIKSPRHMYFNINVHE